MENTHSLSLPLPASSEHTDTDTHTEDELCAGSVCVCLNESLYQCSWPCPCENMFLTEEYGNTNLLYPYGYNKTTWTECENVHELSAQPGCVGAPVFVLYIRGNVCLCVLYSVCVCAYAILFCAQYMLCCVCIGYLRVCSARSSRVCTSSVFVCACVCVFNESGWLQIAMA